MNNNKDANGIILLPMKLLWTLYAILRDLSNDGNYVLYMKLNVVLYCLYLRGEISLSLEHS
jgi:hypothetical protein